MKMLYIIHLIVSSSSSCNYIARDHFFLAYVLYILHLGKILFFFWHPVTTISQLLMNKFLHQLRVSYLW
jgi:hypothetical protein